MYTERGAIVEIRSLCAQPSNERFFRFKSRPSHQGRDYARQERDLRPMYCHLALPRVATCLKQNTDVGKPAMSFFSFFSIVLCDAYY